MNSQIFFHPITGKILDFAIMGIILLFFVGILAFEYKTIGLSEAPLSIPTEWKYFFDVLMWFLIIFLIADLAIKYKKVNNPKKFVKKYWIDIVMLVLIPVFSVFKFLKIGISMIKKLKTAKMSAKALHKTKKVIKK